MAPITLTIPRPQLQPPTAEEQSCLQKVILAAALTHVEMKKRAALKAIEASHENQCITQDQSFEMAQILLLVSVSWRLTII
jgi:hypothetical protein